MLDSGHDTAGPWSGGRGAGTLSEELVNAQVKQIVDLLGLSLHPEGGFYRETFRSDQVLALAPAGRKRNTSTAIYFLLPAGSFSAFHMIQADELWHHYAGDAVEIHTITPRGDHRIELLGGDLQSGERPQIVVPAGTLQAALPRGTRFALCGCTVSPGFDFADFEMPGCAELLARFPRHEDVIRRLTRT